MSILGISAFFHDSAACLVRDGKIIAAALGSQGGDLTALYFVDRLAEESSIKISKDSREKDSG
jgi:hypothetical protein